MRWSSAYNQRNKLKYVYGLLWVIVAVAHFFILHLSYSIRAEVAVLDSLLFNGLFALIGAGLWYMVRFTDLNRRKFIELAFYHLSGAAIVLMLWLGPSYGILKFSFADQDYLNFLNQTLTIRIISGIFYYLGLVSIYYLLINFKELKGQKEKEERLTTLLQEAELNLLRSQIRPHFLFNSLNSISSLTMTDPEKAQEMVIQLSEFMRYSLNSPEQVMSTVEKELEHTQLYLEIEKVRFGNRLSIDKNIEQEAMHWKVPSMLLQPLLENAVKYGVYESLEAITIKLSIFIEDNGLTINVGNPYDDQSQNPAGTGTGLKNIKARLSSIYNQFDLIQIRKSNNYFEVVLKIPHNVPKN